MSSEIDRLRRVTGASAIHGPGPLREVEIVPSVADSRRSKDEPRKRQRPRGGRGRTKDVVTLSDEARSIEQESTEMDRRGSQNYQELAAHGSSKSSKPGFEDLLDRVIGVDPGTD